MPKQNEGLPGLVETRETLAQWAIGNLTAEERLEHSRLVARYVAAAIRQDRKARATHEPPREPSIMERIFGLGPFAT